MFHIAIVSLIHDRGKFLAALGGVSLAVTLVLGQSGLYAGFRQASSAIIRHVVGDVWVMARGVHVLENAELLSSGIRDIVAGLPCVGKVRPLVLAWTAVRQPTGALETAIVLGYDSQGGLQLPWTYARGLPSDLDPVLRVAVDRAELTKLELPDNGVDGRLDINGKNAYVAAVTQGIRAFTLTPYVFTTFDNAHRLLGLPWRAPSYVILDLQNPSCTEDVIRRVNQGWIEEAQQFPLLVGQELEISIELEPRKGLVVPRSALHLEDGHAFVRVAGWPIRCDRSVEVVAADDANVVVQGVGAGTRVIVR